MIKYVFVSILVIVGTYSKANSIFADTICNKDLTEEVNLMKPVIGKHLVCSMGYTGPRIYVVFSAGNSSRVLRAENMQGQLITTSHRKQINWQFGKVSRMRDCEEISIFYNNKWNYFYYFYN
ncbi:MAG: hypothetical protein HOP11_10040 [Saprospiraceae bacterium]|nr:hypothetical protein [Saprospiraceae bacterium]